MHIGIIGTRGIPNNYGGFEQCAQYLAEGLVKRGFTVSVYNSHNHPYQKKEWNGVEIIHVNDPEHKYGTIGQFIYDFNAIQDTQKRKFDIILQLGYTSSSVWGRFLPRKKSIVTTNMDGLEWKRSKFSKPVRKYLEYAEGFAVKYSDYLISDSLGIQEYLKEKFGKDSVYIAYGAHLFTTPDTSPLPTYNVTPYGYDMLVARLEPENSIEMILDGVVAAKVDRPFLVVGKHETKYGEFLKAKYQGAPTIRFVGGIYNIDTLNNIRYYSNVYFHGHTVGGTNPSLLEAMASGALLCAHENVFNKYILEKDALYFTTVSGVVEALKTVRKEQPVYQQMIQANNDKITRLYNWDIIIEKYADHFRDIYARKTGKAVSQNKVR
ncbi:glycosyltransferase [Nibrella saemangeumensis]|uniref:Glycosyltransferase n=1 Tax=Nibrella saemangeumensis TaxID=1084526 RepID=A0ABP8MH95_9BACT